MGGDVLVFREGGEGGLTSGCLCNGRKTLLYGGKLKVKN